MGLQRIGIKRIGLGGLGLGRTGGGGIWTPQSLVVENAAPTHVVMTGAVTNTTAIASDFTIAGFTVSSLSRDITNKILTLTLSVAVIYSDTLTVVYKGNSYSVTNNVVIAILPWSLANSFIYELWEITGTGSLVGKKRGDILTVGGTIGSYTFRVPNTSPYIILDTDYIWFKTDTTQRTTTEAELIGYDLPRTIVKYDSTSPYSIKWVAILTYGATLTTDQENTMRDLFQLSIWWNNTLSFHGAWKGNRGIGQNVWSAEIVIPTGVTMTLISGGVKYDWTDNTGGTAQTEIWCRNDSADYTTATYTINAGTVTKSETVNPVDLRYCKLRTVKDGVYSAFTSEISIAMLGAEIIANGDFASSSGWVAGLGWTISGGMANFNRVYNNTAVYSAGTVIAGHKYRIKITSANNSGAGSQLLAFHDINYNHLFPSPFNTYYNPGNGSYTYYLIAAAAPSPADIGFIAYGSANWGQSFSIDNLSLKEILVP